MKKILGLTALIAAMTVPAYAGPGSVNVRKDQSNNPVDYMSGGYLHKRNSATAEMLVCSGRCLLAGIIVNTGVSTTFLRIRNTSTEGGDGALVLEHRYSQVNTIPGGNPIVLPILLDKGIAIKLSSVTGAEEATVLYLDLDD